MSTALVTFRDSRVGRNHAVEPVTYSIPKADPAAPTQHNVDDLTRRLYATVRKYLLSRDVEVHVEWPPGGPAKGFAYAGFHTVAEFTVEVTP